VSLFDEVREEVELVTENRELSNWAKKII